MRALLLPLLLLITGVAPAAAAPKDDGMKDYVIPVGWNALLNKERKTALIIGEFKTPSRGRGKVTPLNRETEAELLAAIKKLGYTVVRPPAPPSPKGNPTGDVRDRVIPVGWNALINHDQKTALVIGEFKSEGRAHGTLEVLNRETEAELLAEISKLGYTVQRPPPRQPNMPNDIGFKDFVIPVGWNALLNHDKKTALVIGEYKRPGSAHSKLSLLHADTEAELMAEINKLSYAVIRPIPPPTSNMGVVRDEVIPVGWNALLNDERKTALVIGEYQREGKSHGTVRVLNRGTEAELMAEIAKLGYEVQRPPARQARTNAPPGDGSKELVLPIGWNALLNMEDRTADILGESKTEGRIRSKLTLLNCETEAELVSEINLLSFTILPTPPNQKK